MNKNKQSQFKLVPKYYFGKNVVQDFLPEELEKYQVKTIMLTYGGGSIKNNGLYDTIINIAKKAKIKVIEHGGIKPNPRDLDIYEASKLAREKKVDLIIAAGGGSVIDASKVIAALATNPNYRSTAIYINKPDKIKEKPLPIFSIITLAATGSENNNGSVVTIEKTKIKRAVTTKDGCPVVVFEDPTYTLSLS